MSILKSITTLVILFMLSFYIVSCGGGGSGGGTTPSANSGSGNGDGNGNGDDDDMDDDGNGGGNGDGNGGNGNGDGNGGNGNGDDDDMDDDGNGDQCPSGQTRVNGQCVPPEPQECPPRQTRVNGQCVSPEPQSCPAGQTGTPPNCVTFDPSTLSNETLKFTDSSTDGGGVIFVITRDGSSNETRRLFGIVRNRSFTFSPNIKDDDPQSDPFHFNATPELDSSIDSTNGIFRDYVEFSTGGAYSTDYRFYNNLGVTGATGIDDQLFVEFRGFSGAGFDSSNWALGVYGPELSALPTGAQTYKGGTLSIPKRLEYDGRKAEGGIFYRPFTMSVNFGTGVGSINKDTESTLLLNQVDLIGGFTVDLTTGTYSVETGDMMNIVKGGSSGTETLPANFLWYISWSCW